jgi:hypothetical protein
LATLDSSGKGRTLTANGGATSVAGGKFGNCGDCSSSKSFGLGSSMGYTGGAYSISTWVKNINDITSGDYNFIILINHGATATGLAITYRYNSGNRQIIFDRTRYQNSDAELPYTIGGSLSTTGFTHLVLTYSGSYVKGYYNGSYVGQVASSGNGGSSSDGFQICSGVSQYIDDLYLVNRELTSIEVSQIHSGGLKSILSGGSPMLFGGGVTIG